MPRSQKPKKQLADRDAPRLRVKIDRRWTPEQFAQFFKAVKQLHHVVQELAWISSISSELRRSGIREFENFPALMVSQINPSGGERTNPLIDFNSMLYRGRPLYLWLLDELSFARIGIADTAYVISAVGAIEYSSPGFTDILGVGKVLEVLFDNISRMCRYFSDRGRRDLEVQLLREDVERNRLANAGFRLDNQIKELRLSRAKQTFLDSLVELDEDFATEEVVQVIATKIEDDVHELAVLSHDEFVTGAIFQPDE